MKHYLNPQTGDLHAYEDDGSQDYIIPSDFKLLTDAEFEQVHIERRIKNSYIDADNCKIHAKMRLLDTDWTQLSDVSIKNKDEFNLYRTIIRQFYLNPVENPFFPERPNPIWD
jgi:hypothetical protein